MDMHRARLLLTPIAASTLTRSLLPPGVDCAVVNSDGWDAAPGNSVRVITPDECRSFLVSAACADSVAIVWIETSQLPDAALLASPRVVGALGPGLPAATVYSSIRSAFALLPGAGRNDAGAMLEKVLEIGRALAGEKDLDVLLGLILGHARALTGADGASIYTRDSGGQLYFRLWQNASLPAPVALEKTPVGEFSIAGYVARTGEVVGVEDAYAIDASAPYHFNPGSDDATGYRTRSLLTLPLTSKSAEVVGVLQLVNRKDREDTILRTPSSVEAHVLPFDSHSRKVALALAGQAGVALENSILYADIERLFEGFIKASVQAIEARDPVTAGHSFRVAEFTEKFALAVDRCDSQALRETVFSRAQLREIRYAALLHDFGKVGVRENVLVKSKKLHPLQLDLLRQRFRHAAASVTASAYRGFLDLAQRENLDAGEIARRRPEIDRRIGGEHLQLEHYLDLVLRANEPAILDGEISGELRELLDYSFADGDARAPLLYPFEFADLAVIRGNLNPAERAQIESHVNHTFRFLNLIPWTRDLAALPTIAFAHHEKLDGTGYPRGLRQGEIPLPARMMTISDIYDALTAPDRPYKQAVSVERALDILSGEAQAGKIDGELLQVFINARCYLPAPGVN
ncbi:MAG: HD domain-containing phosphohydrolase [Acidiferrobacterales bacterium]